MKGEIKIRDEYDNIFENLESLMTQISLAKNQYPQAFKEIATAHNLEIGNCFRKSKLKRNEVKNITIASLKIDLMKKEYANN